MVHYTCSIVAFLFEIFSKEQTAFSSAAVILVLYLYFLLYYLQRHSSRAAALTHIPEVDLGILSVFLYFKVGVEEETLFLLIIVIYYLVFISS